MIRSIIQHFFKKNSANMSEQEKKWQRIYYLLNAETKPKFICIMHKKRKKNNEKEMFKEYGEWWIEQKTKRNVFNSSSYGD